MGKVAILGSGNAACAFSAYLGKNGHDVSLCDDEQFKDNLEYMIHHNGLNMTGVEQGFGKISMVTTDFEKTIDNVEVIMVVVPAFGHKPMAKKLAPYLKDGQIVILNPGAVFGAVEFLNTLRACGNTADITVAETSSNMFATRRITPDTVQINAIKKKLPIATIPSNRVKLVVDKLKVFFNSYVVTPSTIVTSLLYTNPVLHTPGVLLNIGWIEHTGGNFNFYYDGISRSVAKVGNCIDKERCELSLAMGYPSMTLMEQLIDWYGPTDKTDIYEYYHHSKVHSGNKEEKDAPADLATNRYILEDIPYGLVPMSEMAKIFQIPTPHMDALIKLASTANDINYREVGRNLMSLGLAGKSKDEIISFITDRD